MITNLISAIPQLTAEDSHLRAKKESICFCLDLCVGECVDLLLATQPNGREVCSEVVTVSTNPDLTLTEVLANGLLRLKSSSCFILMVLAFCQNWNLSGRFGPVGKETFGYGLSDKLILGLAVQRGWCTRLLETAHDKEWPNFAEKLMPCPVLILLNCR